MAASTSDRLPHIDGLRAIAVLAVIMSHAAKYTLDFRTSPFFHAMYEGAHGVDLFFVISGLCLSLPALSRLSRSGATTFSVTRFAAARLFRIFPPYWFAFLLVIVSSLAMVRAGFQPPWPTIRIPDATDALRQLFLVENGNELVGSYWTLAIELRWYLAFPILLWLWTRAKPVFVMIGIASLVAFHTIGGRYLDLATLPAFMLGIVAADLTVRGARVARYAWIMAVVSVFVALRFEYGHLAYAYQDQIWWQIVAFFVVLAGCNVPWLKRLLSTPTLVLIGSASYSVYLFHDPVMGWYGKYDPSGSPIVAALIGLLTGLLGWMLFERWYMTSAWRPKAIARLRDALDRLGAFCPFVNLRLKDGRRIPEGQSTTS